MSVLFDEIADLLDESTSSTVVVASRSVAGVVSRWLRLTGRFDNLPTMGLSSSFFYSLELCEEFCDDAQGRDRSGTLCGGGF